MGEKIARHTKPNAKLEKADRPAHRVIAKSRFSTLDTMEDVIQKLIGSNRPRGFVNSSQIDWSKAAVP